MAPTTDFYALLSSLLRQTAQNPDAPPAIPLHSWSAESKERRLLEDLQAALDALHSGGQNPSSQVKERERRYQSIFEMPAMG
jgi:hypothetical protein